MKIIITDRIKDCPKDLPSGYKLVQVKLNQLDVYSGNKEVEIIVCIRGFAKELEKYEFPSLKLVQLFSVGYDNINPQWFKDRGIILCNGGVYDCVLAEYVMFALLMIAKRFHSNINNRCFRPLRNYHYMTEISGKTIGIMGCW